MKASAIAILCGLSLWAGAASAAVPGMDGVWGGEDAHGQRISLHFEGGSLLLSDTDNVVIARWQFLGGSKMGDTWEFPMAVHPLQWLDRQGGLIKMHRRPQITATLYISRTFKVCIDPKGWAGRKLTGSKKEARCVALTRAGSPPRPTPKAAPAQTTPKAKANSTGTETPDAPNKSPKIAPNAFNECVARCVRQNQMRATGPDVIEADCRRECRKAGAK